MVVNFVNDPKGSCFFNRANQCSHGHDIVCLQCQMWPWSYGHDYGHGHGVCSERQI